MLKSGKIQRQTIESHANGLGTTKNTITMKRNLKYMLGLLSLAIHSQASAAYDVVSYHPVVASIGQLNAKLGEALSFLMVIVYLGSFTAFVVAAFAYVKGNTELVKNAIIGGSIAAAAPIILTGIFKIFGMGNAAIKPVF